MAIHKLDVAELEEKRAAKVKAQEAKEALKADNAKPTTVKGLAGRVALIEQMLGL